MSDCCATKERSHPMGHENHMLHTTAPARTGQHAHGTGSVMDPVCGMAITVTEETPSASYYGETCYFCSPRCRDKFESDPERYAAPQVSEAAPAPAGGKWTCPMHPQIVRDAPGACPICGMALEPMTPAAESR